MGHLFYFIGLLIFLSNITFLMNFFDYIKTKEWFLSFYKVTKKFPLDKDFKRGDYNKFKKMNGIIGLNFIWMFFGLITNSWKIFIVLLLFNLTVDISVRIIGEFKLVSKFFLLLRIIITSVLIMVLTMNHFHLHLDLFGILSSRFF